MNISNYYGIYYLHHMISHSLGNIGCTQERSLKILDLMKCEPAFKIPGDVLQAIDHFMEAKTWIYPHKYDPQNLHADHDKHGAYCHILFDFLVMRKFQIKIPVHAPHAQVLHTDSAQ